MLKICLCRKCLKKAMLKNHKTDLKKCAFLSPHSETNLYGKTYNIKIAMLFHILLMVMPFCVHNSIRIVGRQQNPEVKNQKQTLKKCLRRSSIQGTVKDIRKKKNYNWYQNSYHTPFTYMICDLFNYLQTSFILYIYVTYQCWLVA